VMHAARKPPGLRAIVRAIVGAMTGLILGASLSVAVPAQTSSNVDQTEGRIATAMAGFHRFRSSHSIEDLRATSHALFSAIDQRAVRTGDVVGHRRSVVTAYAQVLQQIDTLFDPTIDWNQIPTACVTPPREPDGRQLPACSDPKDISDSATRAQYIAAVAAKSAEIQHRNAQAIVYLLADETTSRLEIILGKFHTRTPSDTAALDDILRRAGLSEARRTKIHSMF
jgi:hypothetical protein